MSQAPKPAEAVRSPCSGVCTLDAAGQLCVGCLRSGPEIGEWPMATPARQREILAAVQARRRAAPPVANQQDAEQAKGPSHER